MRHAVVACCLLGVALNGCLPATAAGTLAPTLEIVEAAGLEVATQNGFPVPTFDWQPRPRLELDGEWRIERLELDPSLTLADRASSLDAIEDEGGDRHLPTFDDSAWGVIEVPGSMNPPPDGEPGGGWYRRTFDVPREWRGRAVTIRFGSAGYVADTWLNGTWLGYHEGSATPFAFEAGERLAAGEANTLAVRVHAIPVGTRTDVVPWGAIDFWPYAGLTGPVWLEAAPAAHVVRADVVPHLDAIELDVLVARTARPAGVVVADDANAGTATTVPATVRAAIFAAGVDRSNLLDPDPRSLVIDPDDPLFTVDAEVALPEPGGVAGAAMGIQFGEAGTWSPASPALYVLRVELVRGGPRLEPRESNLVDELWTTFGIRHVAVDPAGPSVLLNGEPVFLRGVGLHDEALTYDADGQLVEATPAPSAADVLDQLRDAASLGADFVRAGHQPADPTLLMLADRLGFAVWEEIPLYHASPLVFERSMSRGIPQQMLREMALRDMNRPSVLFHGFANESTGDEERADALAELHEIDRAIDGTRLTGQAAYGWRPDDPTQAPLDVAGFTFYHGVFYGDDPAAGTSRALAAAGDTFPEKPIVVLEFGRWGDEPADEAVQATIFEETFGVLEERRGDRQGGSVAAATWWSLRDFATPLAGIGVEQFGLVRHDGSRRPVADLVAESFAASGGRGDALALDPSFIRARELQSRVIGDWSFVLYAAYALAISIGALGGLLFLLTHRGGRATARPRRGPA